jgi:hypothetical protein
MSWWRGLLYCVVSLWVGVAVGLHAAAVCNCKETRCACSANDCKCSYNERCHESCPCIIAEEKP